MGILNVTPDSFSDGGAYTAVELAVARAEAMVDEGAHIIDVGGESTRPGAEPVRANEEVARVVPIIEALADAIDVPISIDTSKAEVAQAALDAGASWINDVRGLTGEGMLGVAVAAACPVVIMRHETCHGDVVESSQQQLGDLVARAIAAGVATRNVIVDPGLGFGQRPGASVADNMALIEAIPSYGYPVLIGASRKRFVGTMSGDPNPIGERRIRYSAEVASRAGRLGAAVLRVHDVAPTVTALNQ